MENDTQVRYINELMFPLKLLNMLNPPWTEIRVQKQDRKKENWDFI